MKKSFIIISLLLLFLSACSNEPTPGCSNDCDPLIFESVQFSTFVKTDNVIYGNNSTAHTMSVYEPENDTRDKRPLVILLSGGSFGAIDISKLAPLAKELVKYGFVVATAGYRTGDATAGTPYITRLIEAVQDSKASVRYFRKEASSWQIDPEFIVIGGWSAGGITSLNHAYIDEGDIVPEYADYIDQLGGIEGDQGNSGYASSVKAVISLAGALLSANEVIEAGELPLYAIHGSNDPTIPNQIYPNGTGSDLFWYGSTPLVDHLTSLNIQAEAFVIAGGGHSTPVDNPDQYISELIDFLRSIE